MTVHKSGSPYRIEPYNRFFEANRRIVEHEIQPGHTVTFISQVDLTAVERLRPAGEQRPSYTAFVAKAVALALREYPYANRRVVRRAWFWPLRPRVQCFEACDIAVAVERDVPGAESVAFVDVLRQVDQLSLAQINSWLRQLAGCNVQSNQQWRQFSSLIARLPQWLSSRLIRLPLYQPGMWVRYRGGAVLLSSPAKYGVDSVVATWSWPLGVSFGYVKDRPVVCAGRIMARPTFDLVLNFDRRIMAGAPAARFFKRIVDILENAEAHLTTA